MKLLCEITKYVSVSTIIFQLKYVNETMKIMLW
jgi:hypothetical protein